MFCRMEALPVGRVPIFLNVDVPDRALTARIGRITPNRAAAPRDSRFGQNERPGDSAIRRFGNS